MLHPSSVLSGCFISDVVYHIPSQVTEEFNADIKSRRVVLAAPDGSIWALRFPSEAQFSHFVDRYNGHLFSNTYGMANDSESRDKVSTVARSAWQRSLYKSSLVCARRRKQACVHVFLGGWGSYHIFVCVYKCFVATYAPCSVGACANQLPSAATCIIRSILEEKSDIALPAGLWF